MFASTRDCYAVYIGLYRPSTYSA